jgi:cytidylate kinase
MRRFIIAIDGPAGAGKGTVARAVAQALGWRYIDTGAMYRAVAWKAKREQLPLDDEAAIAALAERASFTLTPEEVRIDGEDVTRAIRTPEIDEAAARVARLPKVREVLARRQRAYAREGPLVMEGRDIGTVVFPEADVKIYLDASPEERARRRAADPAHGAADRADLARIAQDLLARDASDQTRPTAPLVRAPDAWRIDTTSVPVDEVVRQVLTIVRARLGE